jgi:hypothetical protein
MVSLIFQWYTVRGFNFVELLYGFKFVGLFWNSFNGHAPLLNREVYSVRRGLLTSQPLPAHAQCIGLNDIYQIYDQQSAHTRAKEVVRTWILARRERASVPAVLGSTVGGQFLNATSNLMILRSCTLLYTNPNGRASAVLQYTGLVILLLSLESLIGLAAVVCCCQRVVDISRRSAIGYRNQWLTINLIGLVYLLPDRSITWSGMTGLAKRS